MRVGSMNRSIGDQRRSAHRRRTRRPGRAAPPQPLGRPDTAEPLVRPSAMPISTAPPPRSAVPRRDPPGRLDPQQPKPGNRDDRQEQRRAEPEQQQQEVADIGAEAAQPVGRRTAGGGGEATGRCCCGWRARRRAATLSASSSAPRLRSASRRGHVAQLVAPVRPQVASRARAAAVAIVSTPTDSSAKMPCEGLRGQAKS